MEGLIARISLVLALAGSLAACLPADEALLDDDGNAVLAEGDWAVSSGTGYLPAEEAKVLGITAHLDRTLNTLTFKLVDGTEHVRSFLPRPLGDWQPDCATETTSVLDELADLSGPDPALQLESLRFETPLVHARCSARQMVLTNSFGSLAPTLVFDAR